MAKLPYTFTICPDGPEPVRYTASCPEMVVALMNGDDLTIDQRKGILFPQPGKTNLEVVPASKESKKE
jgi:hypothetical protein